MAEEGQGEIIIKKVKKGGHGGHHGGAWKVAYADFVTAMMAFFLLLWLLNATTEEQKLGIADYFAPSSNISKSTSGSDGLLGGQSISKDGALVSQFSSVGVQMQLPPEEESEQTDPEAEKDPLKGEGSADEKQLEEFRREQERKQFEETAIALKTAIAQNPELSGLEDNLLIDQTPEGLRIQLVDQHGTSMFPSGSSNMLGHTEKLLKLVADAIQGIDQQIAIKGHTDATPYNTANGYTNWELSADRANASRRALINAGFKAERVASVEGLAATEPLDPAHPNAEVNRRISIILLKDQQEAPPKKPKDSGRTLEVDNLSASPN
ncbi:flagellar motor protein MotB [Kiloniella laminariae]|uniref:Flagellar motor protein MotB n=1 Tax=Kiloniella laminariae TaxID=454162 RepID=A0ABT4LGD1_9PROT|nr:flagellar motor protein MotB [Kiloniella laminariae]MCZ4280162.1 flagellar motor protein MotB [Kiloniella laminariae]